MDGGPGASNQVASGMDAETALRHLWVLHVKDKKPCGLHLKVWLPGFPSDRTRGCVCVYKCMYLYDFLHIFGVRTLHVLLSFDLTLSSGSNGRLPATSPWPFLAHTSENHPSAGVGANPTDTESGSEVISQRKTGVLLYQEN